MKNMKKYMAMAMICMTMVANMPITALAANPSKVKENNVNLRKAPGTYSVSLGQVNKGDKFTFGGYKGALELRYPIWVYANKMTTGQNKGKAGFLALQFVE